MTIYKYTAVNNDGKKIKGQLKVVNKADLEHKLHELGLYLISCKEVKDRFSFFGQKLSDKDLILLCIQLEQFEKAGISIIDALNDIRDSADNPKIRNMITDIADSVRNGMILSKALDTYPQIFDKVFVSLVAAGERTGALGVIFAHLSNHLKWVYDIKAKIKKATLYPMFLITLMMGIISLMMLYVVPKLTQFLTAQNFALPIATKALIATSGFLQYYWPYVFSTPIIFYVVIKVLNKTNRSFAYLMDAICLKLPIIGILVLKMDVARFCRFFSITYKSGIDILDCLEIAGSVVDNLVIASDIEYVREQVSQGSSLTTSLKNTDKFSSMVIRMFKVGEEGGQLDQTLENVNFFFDKEVNDAMNKLIGMIQPTLSIVMGGLMFWITFAVFGPLYGSFSKMNF